MIARLISTMDGFDALPVPYLASPLSLDDVTAAEYLSVMPSYSYQDPNAAYDSSNFLG